MQLHHSKGIRILITITTLLSTFCSVDSFTFHHDHRTTTALKSKPTEDVTTRREVLSILISTPLLITPSFSQAAQDDDDDMTKKLFNPDGSLKSDAGISETSTFTTIAKPMDDNTQIIYRIPSKISSDYIDSSNNLKSCNSISVYGTSSTKKDLEKATSIGVAKALRLEKSDMALEKADVVSGRKRNVSEGDREVLYYDFDLAVAPETCSGESKEDLGLGFCPYDNIVLISAAVVNDKMYIFQLECTRDQWRRANSDLKEIRKSFRIVDAAVAS